MEKKIVINVASELITTELLLIAQNAKEHFRIVFSIHVGP